MAASSIASSHSFSSPSYPPAESTLRLVELPQDRGAAEMRMLSDVVKSGMNRMETTIVFGESIESVSSGTTV